jgi:hypothetical protein
MLWSTNWEKMGKAWVFHLWGEAGMADWEHDCSWPDHSDILFWQDWGFELKALHLLCRHCTTWATLPLLFFVCFRYFSNRVLLHSGASMECNAIWVSLCSWDDRQIPPQPAIEWGGVLWAFCSSWPWIMILQISASQVARVTGLSHHARLPRLDLSSSPYRISFGNSESGMLLFCISYFPCYTFSPLTCIFLC